MAENSPVEIFDRNFKTIKEEIFNAAVKSGRKENGITLLAATKTQDIQTVNHAIKSGITVIGENRVQEFLSKKDLYLPVRKDFIGHLQSNKAKFVVGECEYIHSVDSVHLAKEISKVAKGKNTVQKILLEVNIGDEESKSGLTPSELFETAAQIAELDNIKICGLMAIPPVASGENSNAVYFDKMYKLFVDNRLKNIDNIDMNILSMGMSDDYACAVKCGANLVRIGTALFGRRAYK